MSTTPPPQALPTETRTDTGELAADDGAFAWLRALGPRGRRAFGGAFGGYALDSYDYFTLPLSMVAHRRVLQPRQRPDRAAHHRHAGRLGDRRRRSRASSPTASAACKALMITVDHVRGVHRAVRLRAQLRDAAGLPRPPGARLRRRVGGRRDPRRRVRHRQAPRTHARRRSRARGRSAGRWPSIVYTLVFQFLDDDIAWRVMFWTGALPALLVIYVRRNVSDAPAGGRAAQEQPPRRARSRRSSRHATCCAYDALRAYCCPPVSRAATTRSPPGCPRYLKTERGLTVVGTGGYPDVPDLRRLHRLPDRRLSHRQARPQAEHRALRRALRRCASWPTPTSRRREHACCSSSDSRSASACRRSSAASAPSSASCTRRPCAARARASPTTPAARWAPFFPTLVGFLADSWGVGGALVFGAVGYGLAAARPARACPRRAGRSSL